jgi:hypothetical protein
MECIGLAVLRVSPASLRHPEEALRFVLDAGARPKDAPQVLLSLAFMLIAAPESPTPIPLPHVVTGANLRPVGDKKRGYGTRTARETMERLRNMGVNTIAVLMEGHMRDLADTEIRPPSDTEQDAIADALFDANRLGLATILIPHIYLDDGRWRGEIALPDPERKERWWTSYFAFIACAQKIASRSGTTLLSIGVELKALSKSEDTRRRMIDLASRTRRDFHGLITYSANWDEAEQVAFWDAVDVAGVNGYYPLTPDPMRGAEAIARRLERLASIAAKEVIVLEVGYRSSPSSFVRPWEWPDQIGARVDDGAQVSAWSAVLASWLGAQRVRGLLVWVIPTDPDDPASEPRHGFNPLNKPAEQIIRRAFLSRASEATR